MKKYILFFTFLLVSISILRGEDLIPKELKKTDANIIGHVVDKKTGEHLAYISVSLKGTSVGTTTDGTGHYFLKNLPEGKFIIQASFIGYRTESKEIVSEKGKTLEINFELLEDNVSLNEVVVSANRNETTRRLAPTLVSVLDVKTFERTNSVSLSQGLNYQPGLRVENNCQNCGFTQVRMNGLGGAYSQILIDSRPIFSSLSGVYGLEQIPANMIERVEVVRGGGSALYGASAIAGTINIITKEALRNSAQISHNIMSIGGSDSFNNSTSFNGSLVSDDGKMGAMIFGQKRHRSAYDKDGDGFSEIPQLDSRTLGFRSYLKTSTYSKLTMEYHNMHEFRRGGDRLNEEPFNAYITEQVESFIDGGGLKYDIFGPDKHRISIYTSAQLVKRKSYYGGGTPISEAPNDTENTEARLNSYGRTKGLTYTAGGQYSYNFDQLLFMPSEITAGTEYTYDEINDRSGYRTSPIDQSTNIKSVFAQNEWRNEKWSFLVGGRLDKHNFVDKAIFSPRANIRFNPTSDINLRVSYGQGFRAPQLFDEDLHVDLAGGAQIIRERDPNLKEEKSHSLSTSADWYKQIGAAELNFLVEGFFTRLSNPFTSVSAVQKDGTIIKTTTNASGAKVYGVNLEARGAYSTWFQLQMGATIQKSRYDDAIKWSDDLKDDVKAEKKMMRTPDVYGYFIATFAPMKSFNTSLTGNYTGSMLVPHEAGVIEKNRTEKSDTFFELGWKATYTIPFYKGSDIDLSIGIQNIFNSYQQDFDMGKDRASSYVYGPALPRSYYMSAKLCF